MAKYKRPPVPPAQDGKGAPSWRERVDALRHLPAFLRLIWGIHRGYAVTMLTLRLVKALVPVASLWVGKLIIDQVVAAAQGAADFDPLWRYVGLEFTIAVAGELCSRGFTLFEDLLSGLVSNSASIRLMKHASTLDLEQFEDPQFHDHLERARLQTAGRFAVLSQLLNTGQDFLTLATLGAALLAFNAWLGILLLLAVLPGFVGETHFAALGYSLRFQFTAQRRQLNYLRWMGASHETVKEVQMFGLATWLVDRYRSLAGRYYDETRRLAIRRSSVGLLLSLLGTGGYYLAYVTILLAAMHGRISIGQLTFLAVSFSRSRDLIQRLLQGASDIYEQSLYLRDLFVFLEMRPKIVSHPHAPPVPRLIREGFAFEDVGFRYPESERWAIRHVSFRLRTGERIALVGENGAGKTTITKLLARLYDPTEGRITLDGVDLREYDLASLRRAIGVIFQDFVGYAMRFDENIGVGQIDSVRGYFDSADEALPSNGLPALAAEQGSPVPTAIRMSAERSLASTLLPRLPDGYRQMLGRHFDGGVNLSGGEWQKIALARAYMRDAQVLILDEPTAALDARAESEVFTRFAELMSGRMAVLVSHRFSTVRMADRIIVLAGGTLAEEGTHEELMLHDGLYAELFGMQAAGYR